MIQQHVNLKAFNTFGISVVAEHFARFETTSELQAILKQAGKQELLILGGGSNLLLTKDVKALVLKNEIKGIEIMQEDETSLIIRVGAGEVWHDFVRYCVDRNYAGVENLSLIPGSVGASPMQNIGAYGVEIKDVFEALEAYHIESGEIHRFSNADCQFGYRESVFKKELKGQYIITHVHFKLSKEARINSAYGAIESELQARGIEHPSIKDISDVVIAIRQSKLPDPAKIGNAGSFFKNPVVPFSVFEQIKQTHPDAPSYPAGNGVVKIPAGWLIEQAGWKGKTFEHYGVHKNQALVLVNYGGATGEQIWNLSTEIKDDIFEKFGVELEREVNII